MDIRNFIGMPLRYAISVLQEKNVPYEVENTTARSRFFPRDEEDPYVVRARERDGVVYLLVNANLKKSESVTRMLQGGEVQE